MHTPTNKCKFAIVLERTHAGCSKNMQTPHGKTSVPVDGTLLLLAAPTTAPLCTKNSNRNWKEKEIADLLEWSWVAVLMMEFASTLGDSLDEAGS